MKRTNSLKCQLAILAVAAMVGSAWAQQPGSGYTSSLTKTKATVTAINAATREITIKGNKGPMTVRVVGPDGTKEFLRTTLHKSDNPP